MRCDAMRGLLALEWKSLKWSWQATLLLRFSFETKKKVLLIL
jgi:hypothetical protein